MAAVGWGCGEAKKLSALSRPWNIIEADRREVWTLIRMLTPGKRVQTGNGRFPQDLTGPLGREHDRGPWRVPAEEVESTLERKLRRAAPGLGSGFGAVELLNESRYQDQAKRSVIAHRPLRHSGERRGAESPSSSSAGRKRQTRPRAD